MFGRDSDEDDDDSFFTFHNHDHNDVELRSGRSWLEAMGVTGFLYLAVGVVLVVIVIACCCSRKRSRGQVLSPATVPPAPPAPNNSLPTQYPQQQYSPYPVQAGAASYPVQPYPAVTPYPAHPAHPAPAPYPAVTPYPAPAPAPYPTTVTPYPTAAPYSTAPSAPDHNVFFGVAPPGWTPAALPPSYEQAVGAPGDKHPAYNPHPH